MMEERIGQAMMLAYDNLKDDEQGKQIVDKIDTASNDEVLKEGFQEAIDRFNELGQTQNANKIAELTAPLFL